MRHAAGQLFDAIGSFILPGGLGSLIGSILGTWIGNQFGTSPSPGAVDLLDQAGYLYGRSEYQSSDGGGYEISKKMVRRSSRDDNSRAGFFDQASNDDHDHHDMDMDSDDFGGGDSDTA
jgi:hypothetical protein